MRHKMILFVSLALSGWMLPSLGLADPPTSQPSGDAQVSALRGVLGLAPADLSTLSVSTTQLTAINSAVSGYLAEHGESVAALLAAFDTANRDLKAELMRSPKSYDPAPEADPPTSEETLRTLKAAACATKRGAVQAARTAILTQCATLRTAIDGQLTETQQALLARGLGNTELDVSLKFLDLTEGQQADLKQAREARELVLYERSSRISTKRLREAAEEFASTVDGILTEAQKTQRAAYQAARSANQAVEQAAGATGD